MKAIVVCIATSINELENNLIFLDDNKIINYKDRAIVYRNFKTKAEA